MKAEKPHPEDTLREEYDFSHGERGKYYERYHRGTNLVALEPDVAATFPSSSSVNDALRSLLLLAKRTTAPRKG